MKFSIIICTYNRDEILPECLDSLRDLDFPVQDFELIVIDNFGESQTQQLVERFAGTVTFATRYVYESIKGLSFARNRGILEAAGEWLFYLDDDALLDPAYLKWALLITTEHTIGALGGMYEPWYKYGKPKWYRDEWASSMYKPTGFAFLEKEQYLDGNNFLINKQVLDKIGGFNENIGMIKNQVGYGEETELQVRAKNAGFTIAYDSEMKVRHLVPAYKMKVKWFLRSWYAHGRDYWATYQLVPQSYGTGAGLILRIMFTAMKNLFKNAGKVFKSGYYWQNWIIDSLQIPVWELGRLKAAKHHSTSKQ